MKLNYMFTCTGTNKKLFDSHFYVHNPSHKLKGLHKHCTLAELKFELAINLYV